MIRGFKKLFCRLYEALPTKSRVYFIYTHKNGFDRFRNGLKANTEISYFCYRALKNDCSHVRFLKLAGEDPKKIARIRPQDVVIGHLGETFDLASRYSRRLISFCPWVGHEDHAREGFNCVPKEIEMAHYQKCASVILLTSEFNQRTYLAKPKNFWYAFFQTLQKTKRVRVVHQPIDLNLFQRIKWTYETDNFIYIGNKGHMKGLKDAKKLTLTLQRPFHVYGIEGNNLNHLDTKQVGALPYQADFFLQPGMWEAQCVSILESAARGFIPVVTPDTGYPYDHPFLLRFGDFAYNLQILKNLLNTSPAERKRLADDLYEKLVQDVHHNNWAKLTDVLVEEVSHLFSQNLEL